MARNFGNRYIVVLWALATATLMSCTVGPGPPSADPSASPTQLTACPEIPDGGDPKAVGGSAVSVIVPPGWHAQEAVGPESDQLVIRSPGTALKLSVMVAQPQVADQLPMPGPSVTGTATLSIDGLGTVTLDRTTDSSGVGLRYVRALGSGAAEVHATGPEGTCDQTLIALLAKVQYAK